MSCFDKPVFQVVRGHKRGSGQCLGTGDTSHFKIQVTIKCSECRQLNTREKQNAFLKNQVGID